MKNNKVQETTFLGYSLRKYGLFIVGLIVLSMVSSIWLGVITGFRVVFGAIFTMFLPGFLISHLFYDKNRLGILERVALSFALSLSVIPIIIFFLNLSGISVSSLNTTIVVLAVSAITLAWLGFKKEL